MDERSERAARRSRSKKLSALRALARGLTGEDPAGRGIWRRMLLGRLATLLLDDQAKLTGAELRAMLETLGSESEAAAASGPGNRLPAEFENIVQEIYGVNLQRDVKGAAETGEARGQKE